MSRSDKKKHEELSDLDAALVHVRMWMKYVEEKYDTRLDARMGEVRLRQARVTQSEIERIKYDLVLHEGFRKHEPIVVFHGHRPLYYIVDGHTRARVKWDEGVRRVRAAILSSWDPDIDLEITGMAVRSGGGRERGIWQVPVVERLKKHSEAWARRREDLLKKPQRKGSSGQRGGKRPG